MFSARALASLICLSPISQPPRPPSLPSNNITGPNNMGRRPKTYTFHSRKARFSVYCASTNQQQHLLRHLLTVESADNLRCAIVAPLASDDASDRQLGSLLLPELYSLSRLDKKRVKKSDSSSSEDESDSDSDNDSDRDSYGKTNSRDVNNARIQAILDDKSTPHEAESSTLHGYRIFLEYASAQARSSRAWGTALFEGFDKTQELQATTPVPPLMFADEQDHYIVDLMLDPNAAVHGTPTLDEHATLRLVSERYSIRADQDRVIHDIKLYCRGRAAVPATFERIRKHWRKEMDIPLTPRAPLHQDAVHSRLDTVHPFFPHKTVDKWVERFVGSGKVLGRSEYKPLVLTSKLGHYGKTSWARSLGSHIHILGALDNEVIHAGITKGADVLILDNVKWVQLFNTDMGRALCEAQEKVTWIRRGGERVTTQLTIPVVILNNKKCSTWGQNSKTYWKTHMLWVKVRSVMYDESQRTNHTDVSLLISLSSHPSSSSSSSSLPTSLSSLPCTPSSPNAIEKTSLTGAQYVHDDNGDGIDERCRSTRTHTHIRTSGE